MMHVIKSVELPNHVKLLYVEQGKPQGVPVILLHAFLDSWHSFELVLPFLPSSIHAFALTQRGHGDASRPATGYRFHDFASDLKAFMDDLNLEAAVIAGSSSHGFVAQRFAIDNPDRTLGLVFIGTPLTLRNNPAVLEMWNSTISKLTDPVNPSFVREFVESTLAQPVPKAFLETMVRESLKVPARVWREMVEGFLKDDLSGELYRIKAPTIILWGDQDVISTRSDQVALAAAIANARLVIYPGAGHILHWEEPERFASDLVAFIEEISK